MNQMPEIETRRGRKLDQVKEGALRVFLRDGYEGASVDDIARESGVSKATLYAYFPDKQVLFTEICLEECRHRTNEAESEAGFDATPEEQLTAIAHKITQFMMSDFGRSMFRLMVAEVSRFPNLARNFYHNGLGEMRGKLQDYLRKMADRGQLQISDYELAAEQFVQLCKANIYDRLVLGLVEDIRPEEVERTIQGAVQLFLARYGHPAR